jgi:EmrB/QacA subfamily drug resistance transporter
MRSTASPQSWLALAAVCLSSLMFGLEISSIPAILPTLERVLRADFPQLQWTMNAYTIAVATVLMAAGTFADRYGRKRVFVITTIAFGITSLVCGLAPDMPVLIAGRALQGASGGAMLICQIAVLSRQFQDSSERAKAFGWWGIVFGFGLGFGPLIGTVIAAFAGWAWVFLVHIFIAAVTVVLAVTGVQESRDPEAKRLDLAGIVTLSASVFCLVFFITQGAALGFTSSTALTMIALAVASFIAFILAEKISPHPLFDFSVFRIRRFSGALLGSMGMNFSFWPFMIYLPIWIEAGLGFRGVAPGLALLAYTLPTLVIPAWAERLALRHGAHVVIPAGLFTIGVGFLVMMLAADAGIAMQPLTLLGAVLAGIGLGATNTPVTNTTTGAVSSDRAGMASGIDMSARMISLALNIALMGFVLVAGIETALQEGLAMPMDGTVLHGLAQQIAAGGCSALSSVDTSNSSMVTSRCHIALARGFGMVMLYGAVSVWIAAAISLLLFRKRKSQVSSMAPE